MTWLAIGILLLMLIQLDSNTAKQRKKLLGAIKELEARVDKHEQRWHYNKGTGRVWWQRKDD